MQIAKTGIRYDLTVKDVAEEFDYTEAHVRVLAGKKVLPSVKRGREYRFNREQVEQALIQMDNKPKPVTVVERSELDHSGTEEEYEDLDDIIIGV